MSSLPHAGNHDVEQQHILSKYLVSYQARFKVSPCALVRCTVIILERLPMSNNADACRSRQVPVGQNLSETWIA